MTIKKSSSGVALIVVLGLVAILMIVSVTFTIHMRVERAGAANLRHAVIARQVVKGGLAAALMAIDKQAGISAVPEWYDPDDITSLTYRPFTKFRDGTEVRGYLWRDTIVSFNTNNLITGEDSYVNNNRHTHNKPVSGGVNAQIFSGEVARYFPSGLAYRGYATAYNPPSPSGKPDDGSKWKPIIQPQWQPVFSDTDNDNVMGRYAFFVLNTTCLLDASSMTNSLNARWMGRDPGEIDFTVRDPGNSKTVKSCILTDVLPNAKNGELEFARKNLDNGTYETMAEFNVLNPYVSDCRSFNTLSYDPGPTNDLVYIGGSADELRRHKWDIIHAFYDCGLTDSPEIGKNKYFKKPAGHTTDDKISEQACWAYLGLVDYVDPDDVMEEDPDIGIEPSARPATERMPLVSGFFAVLTVEAKHSRTGTKMETGTKWDDGTDPVKVKFSAKVKVPFVFPFLPASFTPGEAQGLSLEGKADLHASSKGGSAGKREKLRISPQDPSECIVQTIQINNGEDDGWFDVVKSKQGAALPNVEEQLKLPDVKAILRVGGATFRNVDGVDTIQHSFPVGKDNYGYAKGDKEVGFDDDMGMVVKIVGTQTKENIDPDVWFDEDVQSKAPEETPDPDNPKKVTQTRFWETNILVWAEMVDPRFANLAMRDMADDELFTPILFKASHNPDLGSDPRHSIPLLKLKEKAPQKVFDGFDDAGKYVETFEKNLGKKTNPAFGDPAPGTFDFGSYFCGKNGTLEGTSPFVAYLLENPKAVEEFYGMPMDGIQKGGGSGKETETAAVKHRMYVKNGPLESVGELGYLPIAMWQTIRLYDYCDKFGDPDKNRTNAALYRFSKLPKDKSMQKVQAYKDFGYFHPVLDYFTVVPANEVVQGRVNLNALDPGILATAFHNMPIATEINLKAKDYNGAKENAKAKCIDRLDKNKPVPQPQDMPSVKYLAEAIIECREDMGRGFSKLSELGYLFVPGDYDGTPQLCGTVNANDNLSYAALAVQYAANVAKPDKKPLPTKWGEFEREAIIRNSCGLFTMRGQSFIVVVRGESYSAPFGRKKSMLGGTSNSSKTAIANVWRDSIPQNFEEVEAYIAKHKMSAKAADNYRRAHFRFPMYVQFFKIIDD